MVGIGGVAIATGAALLPHVRAATEDMNLDLAPEVCKIVAQKLAQESLNFAEEGLRGLYGRVQELCITLATTQGNLTQAHADIAELKATHAAQLGNMTAGHAAQLENMTAGHAADVARLENGIAVAKAAQVEYVEVESWGAWFKGAAVLAVTTVAVTTVAVLSCKAFCKSRRKPDAEEGAHGPANRGRNAARQGGRRRRAATPNARGVGADGAGRTSDSEPEQPATARELAKRAMDADASSDLEDAKASDSDEAGPRPSGHIGTPSQSSSDGESDGSAPGKLDLGTVTARRGATPGRRRGGRTRTQVQPLTPSLATQRDKAAARALATQRKGTVNARGGSSRTTARRRRR